VSYAEVIDNTSGKRIAAYQYSTSKGVKVMNKYHVIFRYCGGYVTDVTVEAQDSEEAGDVAIETIGEEHHNWIVDEIDVKLIEGVEE
jgi:hypothetical protein